MTAVAVIRFSLIVIAVLNLSQAEVTTIGGLAYNITQSFQNIGKMMVGMAYVAGIGFGISAMFKFKQHKDNPTQIPISTAFALLAVSVLLVFLPGIYGPAGRTIFGKNQSMSTIKGDFTGSGINFSN